jgi:hypothetical protein
MFPVQYNADAPRPLVLFPILSEPGFFRSNPSDMLHLLLVTNYSAFTAYFNNYVYPKDLANPA